MTHSVPVIDPAAPLLFIINAASGRNAEDAKREVLETALRESGRTGELLFTPTAELARVAQESARRALREHSAVIAVGGDGTINSVAQGAHAVGCAMGVVPQGTFNYFARTHELPTEPADAARALFTAEPTPVQVGMVNERVFLVNASLGLYPDLLEDREAYKSRFGRSRLVAMVSAFATLLREHKQLRLTIEEDGVVREVRTPTLFIGNNRLQFERLGLPEAPALEAGHLGAVMAKPIGTRSMLWLLLRGAFGSLGDAQNVESFEFTKLIVRPRGASRHRGTKLAYDGEVDRVPSSIEFRVAAEPLFLLKPVTAAAEAAPVEGDRDQAPRSTP